MNWRKHLQNICKCQSEDEKQEYISTLFRTQEEYYIRFENGPDDELQYPLTAKELHFFADKSRCSQLSKRQESDYDNYDFLEFFRTIHDSFLGDMQGNNYYFFDDDDMKYLRTNDGDKSLNEDAAQAVFDEGEDDDGDEEEDEDEEDDNEGEEDY
jgi:hypothetical protein